MSFLAHLETVLRERPEWESVRSEDGRTLRIAEDGRLEVEKAPLVYVHEQDGAVLLDGSWKLTVKAEQHEDVAALIVDYLQEAFENHGWEVPIVLYGGPLHGRRLTKSREDLAGRLVFARKGENDGDQHAHLYKWRLKRSDAGEYVCVYERTLENDELDRFIARGVASTGPFVLIHDKA